MMLVTAELAGSNRAEMLTQSLVTELVGAVDAVFQKLGQADVNGL